MRAFLVALIILISLPLHAQGGGAACVIAKYNGVVLDYEFIYGKSHPVEAQEEGIQKLWDRGYGNYYKDLDVTMPQNLSNLEHAFVVIIRSDFKDTLGREKSAMGCGFSANSYEDAQWDAIHDLQSYYWGWKPDKHGFEVLRLIRY